MSDRSIEVELSLRADGFVRSADQAADALGKVGKSGDKAAKDGDKGFKSFGDTLKTNRAEVTTLGVGMTAVGASMLALTTKVAKTGIEYNVLQQTSRAALTTLLGGAEAANAQMDKLDAFARTSPFSKAVFIDAQRTLAGFGVQATKIIPILDAVQNAVAAIGGSNQDIAEIVQIFAQIQSQGKITGRELQRFGLHGVDAARILGDALGKTGEQIRSEITSGAIDADTAIGALTDGMQAKFGGAAANVKDTFEGALDRVKAAFRDFSSSAMDPFVGKEGGGLFVSLLNGVADVIRKLDELPEPVKTGMVVVGGLGGAALTAGGSFLLLAPRILDTKDAIKALADQGGKLGKLAGAIGGIGPAVGIAAGALAVAAGAFFIYNQYAQDAKARTDAYVDAMNAAAESGRNLNAALRETVQNKFLTGEGMDWGFVQKTATGFDTVAEAAESVGISVMSMTDAVMGSDAEYQTYIATLDALIEEQSVSHEMSRKEREALREVKVAVEQERDAKELALAVQERVTRAQDEEAAARGDVTSAMQAQIDKTLELMDVQSEAANAALGVRDAQRKFEETLASANATIAENGATLDTSTAAGRANEAALDSIAKSGHDVVNRMSEMVDANGNAVYSSEQVQAAMQRSRDEFLKAAEAAGMEAGEAANLADKLGLIPKNVVSKVAVEGEEQARAVAQRIQDTINRITGKDVWVNIHQNTTMTATRAATGGAIFGPGTATSDSIPALLSNGEHVLTAREVDAFGGHANVYMLRQMMASGKAKSILGFAGGGAVTQVLERPSVGYAPAGRGEVRVTVNNTINNPVAQPVSLEQRDSLEQAASLVKGFV
nr:MAG TPA: tail tape measure protein [Caudoviricetes sp.]